MGERKAGAPDTAELRKARGAFFTPPQLCAFVSQWAIRTQSDRVLEPSCGEAAFLASAASRLRDLGTSDVGSRLFGIELHAESARLANASLEASGARATITVGDFFDVVLPGPFDAVVGNPPYVRYQDFTGTARTKSQEVALAHGVRLTGLASSWASFVVHSSEQLKPDGRLGLVLPAELLTVNYAASVRKYLLDHFASVRLVLFEERVFPGVTEEVVLLLAEGRGPTDHFEVFQASGLDDLADVDARTSKWSPPIAEGKWSAALLPPDAGALFTQVIGSKHFEHLAEWGDPNLGMVTGNNEFFTLTDEEVSSRGLRQTELIPISPPGSRHLRSLSFTQASWDALREEGARVYLFYPRHQTKTRVSQAARKYIDRGARLGVHKAYKCSVRTPWWKVPLTPTPDLFLTYMNHDAPRLVANRAGLLHLNSVHGLVLKPERRVLGMDLLPLAMLNSATLLGAELVGRSYGGGILKLEPKEADVLPVPTVAAIEAAAPTLREVRASAIRLLGAGKLDDVVTLVDEALLHAVCGLSASEVKTLESAREVLFARRRARKG